MTEGYTPNFDLPLEVQQAQERARRASEAASAERSRLAERDRKVREREEREEREAAAARDKKIIEDRDKAGREQAAKDKEAERVRYIAAGGSPDDFEADYPAMRAKLMAERILAAESRLAHPRDYMNRGI